MSLKAKQGQAAVADMDLKASTATAHSTNPSPSDSGESVKNTERLIDYEGRTESQILEEQLDCLCEADPAEKTYEEFIASSYPNWVFATFDFCKEQVFNVNKLKTKLPCGSGPLYPEKRDAPFVPTYNWVYRAQWEGIAMSWLSRQNRHTMKEYFEALPHWKIRALEEIFPNKVVTKHFYAKNNPYNVEVLSCPVHFMVADDIEVVDIENYALETDQPDFIQLYHALGVSTWSTNLHENLWPLTKDVMNIFEISRSDVRRGSDKLKYGMRIRRGLRFLVDDDRVSLKSLLELLFSDRFITKRPKKLYNIINDQYDIAITYVPRESKEYKEEEGGGRSYL